MPRDILFLDQDGTLGDFDIKKSGLFPGVIEFIRSQREAGRGPYIATTSSEQNRHVLSEIEPLLGYFGRESFDACNYPHYIAPDGTPRPIKSDFCRRKELDLDEVRGKQKEFDELFQSLEPSDHSPETEIRRARFFELSEWLGMLVSRKTLEPFDESTRYQNPFTERGFFKDLYLARRIIAPEDYKDLRTVMVGDYGDLTPVFSDPETPLLIISLDTRSGNWNPVSVMLNVLYDPKAKPFEVYDALFAQSRLAEGNVEINGHREKPYSIQELGHLKTFSHEGITYYLGQGITRNATINTRVVLMR